MTLLTKKLFLVFCLLLCFSQFSHGQKQHVIEFNADGKMTVAPPNTLPNGNALKFLVNIDKNSFEKRTLESIENYFSILQKLKDSQDFDYLFLESDIGQKFGCTLVRHIEAIVPLLTESNETITNNRLAYFDYKDSCSTLSHFPELRELIQIDYSVRVDFFNASGKKIREKTFHELKEIDGFPDSLKSYSLISDTVIIPKNTASINFELREIQPKNRWIKDEAESLNAPLIRQFEKSLTEADKYLNKEFFKNYSILKEKGNKAQKYLQNPGSVIADQSWLDSANNLLASLNTTATMGLDEFKIPSINQWMLKWLWLTGGTPKINPFFFQEEALFPKQLSAVEKVTEKEKILVEVFDNMIKSNAIQIESLSDIFSNDQLGYIVDIKERLKAELSTPSPIFEYDKFLYSGIINSFDANQIFGLNLPRSSFPVTYLISHDAAQDFQLMNKYQKEIKDIDQLTVLIQNKKINELLNVTVTSNRILTDNSVNTEELDLSKLLADTQSQEENQLFEEIKKFYINFKDFNRKIEFYSSLQKAPKLPIVIGKDKAPDWQSEILSYNKNIDAPSIAEYKIKSGTGDEEKEVFAGQFRVNKRYNLRFKAGAVYSHLEQKNYTQTGDNTFTEKTEEAGIDGTFGVQIFPFKTDLRQINIMRGRVAPFVYMGFSMKNISENFYPGFGLEIFSGLSLSYNWHIGRSDTLITNNNLPEGIEPIWKSGKSISLLVDPALFVNLFKLGSNKSLVGL